jgi:SAM-dependent methyltransferase
VTVADTAPPPPPSRGSPGQASGLRTALDGAGFTAAALRKVLGTGRGPLLRRRDHAVYRLRLERDGSPVVPLVRLFAMGDAVEQAERERAVGAAAQTIVDLGIARVSGTSVTATVRLVPHDDLLVASDRGDVDTGAEHVAGVHGPSAMLAHLTVRRPVRRALDVGTGNGIQALLLARHAEHVVATDLNERALAFAELNAALNGVSNVELRAGSFLEPVVGERFDVAVANPPYVISPESSMLFRDSGLPRDAVSAELARSFPSALDDGGYATMMVSWVQQGPDPTARPRSWLGDDCDAWILHWSTTDAIAAAAAWNREQTDDRAYAEAVERWLAYYEQEGIDAVAYGAIVFRRRTTGRVCVKAAELPRSPVMPASEQLQRMFANEDALDGRDDAALAESRIALVPEARIVQTVRLADGWRTVDAELVLEGGLGLRGALEGAALSVALGLDGSVPLREVFDRVAAESGADRAAVAAMGTALARRALELGFAELVA